MVIIAVVRLPGRELDELLPSVIPADHARQTIADHYVERGIGRAEGRPWRVLDLGCGSGSSVDLFRARDPDVQWVGLDVPESPEPPTRTDARFETFDGISIPFDEGSFDLVYCKQVLEHVRHPKPLLADVRRILAPGGYFAGSTSQLEPFHSLSMWNYTPLGFYEIAKEAGLRLIELRPSIDGLTLIARRLVRRGRPFDRWWARWWGGSSPLNRVIDAYGRARGLDVTAINATKLLFCGQFTFLAQRID
jgi:SAM-dependent methyltransferase